MADMKCKTYIYTIEQNTITIEHFIKRYHFDEKDRELLLATGRFLSELNTVGTGIIYDADRVICVATLGDRYDRLLDVVAESQHLLLAYSMECFAMEFLSKTYEKMNETVYKETGKWMGEFHFLGENDVSRIEEYLGVLSDNEQGVSSNIGISWRNGMLHPAKSVIFTAEYKEKREDSGCHTCELCDNVTCSFRQVVQKTDGKGKYKDGVRRAGRLGQKTDVDLSGTVYSYGIAQIFGNRIDDQETPH